MTDRDYLRRSIVARIWSPDLRAEFVDRLVALVATGAATTQELDREIQRAQIAVNRNKQGSGGGSACWIALTRWAKSKYAIDGRAWVPPAPTLEPQPVGGLSSAAVDTYTPSEYPAQETKKDDAPVFVVYRNQEGRDCSIITSVLTQKQADALTDELAAGGKSYTHREMRRIINDYNMGIMPPVEHDPYLRKRRPFDDLVERYNLDLPAPFDFDAAARAA